MVFAIVVLGIMAGLTADLMGGGMRAYVSGREALVVSPVARVAMERIVRELRPACDASITITGNQIDFTVPNGNCTTPVARSIRLTGTTLELQVAGGDWNPLAKNVTQLDGDDVFSAVVTDPASACRTIDIQFRVTGTGDVVVPVRTGLFLRNFQCV